MSLHRQRSRARMGVNRASTIPIVNTPHQDVNTTAGSTIYSPSIEESLQDWLSRSISEASHSPTILDSTCCCCGHLECDSFEKLTASVRKLEGDARLAAEIGQSLLHKHETFVVESNQIKDALEQELEESREKQRQLEQLLEDADNTRKELIEKNNKMTWELQKTEKTLRETVSDLEVANARCVQLSNDLKAETIEVDKLRIFKFMVRQADIREESLRAKLEDTKQELAISRKAELTLESKHKKLKTRYETVCSSYERLKTSHQELGITPDDKQLNLAWLRESNEKLRNDVLKLTSAMAIPQAAATALGEEETQQLSQSQQQQQSPQLITLIKELASANSKLKSDLIECRELLSDTRHEVITLNCRIEELERGGSPMEEQQQLDDWIGQHPTSTTEKSSSSTCQHQMHDDEEARYLSISAPNNDQNNHAMNTSRWRLRKHQGNKPPRILRRSTTIINARDSSQSTPPPSSNLRQAPSPASSASMPTRSRATSVVHHHFHLHMHQQHQQQQQQQQQQHVSASPPYQQHEKDASSSSSPPSPPVLEEDSDNVVVAQQHHQHQQQHQMPIMKNSISLTSQATTAGTLASEPIAEEDDGGTNSTPYHMLQTHIAQTLERLRATDIRALNRRLRRAFDIIELSTMSNSIIENILEDIENLRDRFTWVDQQDEEVWRHDVSMEDFFPTMRAIQDILCEVGQLRITMNDLQVEYVNKVKERDIRAEEEVLKKRESRRAAAAAAAAERGALAWLTSVFQLGGHGNNGGGGGATAAVVVSQQHDPSSRDKTLVRSISHESITAKYINDRPSSSSAAKPTVIRRKRSDLDRYGPPSSFPRTRSSHGGGGSGASTSQPRPIPYPSLRTSRSAGGGGSSSSSSVRRSRSLQVPALEYAAVRRKKSHALGLNASIVDIGARGTSPDIDGDWKVGGTTFGATNWLGSK